MGKVNKAEAQEWLESLQQVGEGWWRQVALAVSVGAHTSLGMERREFAQAIGQRMVDSRDAILELHKEGHSMAAIADVLSVSHHTVRNILISEGLIEGEPSVKLSIAERSGTAASHEAAGKTTAASQGDLQAQIDALTVQVEGEKAKGKRVADKLRDDLTRLRESLVALEREKQEQAKLKLTPAERKRAEKEAEAWAAEQGRKILVGFAHITVEGIVGNLEEAASEMRLLIEQQAVTDEVISRIDSARAGFDEEFNVARMSVPEGRSA